MAEEIKNQGQPDKRQPECRRRTAWNKQNNSIWQT